MMNSTYLGSCVSKFILCGCISLILFTASCSQKSSRMKIVQTVNFGLEEVEFCGTLIHKGKKPLILAARSFDLRQRLNSSRFVFEENGYVTHPLAEFDHKFMPSLHGPPPPFPWLEESYDIIQSGGSIKSCRSYNYENKKTHDLETYIEYNSWLDRESKIPFDDNFLKDYEGPIYKDQQPVKSNVCIINFSRREAKCE